MTHAPAAFAVPGEPSTPTGGYVYDARVLAAADGALAALRLPGGFPFPTAVELARTETALTGAAGPLLIDGLAFGALPVALIEAISAPIVALCHHPLGLEPGLAPAVAERLIQSERDALARAAHVVVTSAATKRTLTTDFAVPAERVTVAEPGLDRAEPCAAFQSGAEAANGRVPTILTVASLTPRKGHDVLIEALGRLGDRDWRARFVGPTDRDKAHGARIAARIDEAELGDRIEIVGPADARALEAEYRGADVFALPSRYEGYGMVFAEAMMRALPVVACRAGAVPDVVPQDAGTLVPVDDAAALAEALLTLLADPRRRLEMGARGRGHALTLPGWDATWAKIERVLRAVR